MSNQQEFNERNTEITRRLTGVTASPARTFDQVSRFVSLYAAGTAVLSARVPSSAALNESAVVCLFHDGAGHVYLDDGHLPTAVVAPGQPLACAVEDRARVIAANATIGGLVPLGRLLNHERPAGIAVVASIIGQHSPIALPVATAFEQLLEFEAAVVTAGLAAIGSGIATPPLDEIDAVATHPRRHAIHRTVVTPLLKPFSSSILRGAIRGAVGDAASVLDVSCGDDELIVSLAAEGRDCVGNDVCLNLMRARAAEGAAHGVVYTLHNVVQLPFSKRFEAAICKNTIHHLTAGETADTLSQLDRLADEVVIVDVLDISSSCRARAFNAYYRRFLGDQGRHFLTFDQFRARVCAGFPQRSVRYRQINTIKGRYVMAHIR